MKSKKKQRGFTLIELLAMLVVLGILMGVTIPNMTGILKNQRINTLKSDAINLAERARIKSSQVITTKPALGECIVLTLDYLDDNDDFESGPNGGSYLQYDSFVIYTREAGQGNTTKFNYYVRLVEETEKGTQGIDLIPIEMINTLKKKDVINIMNYGLTGEKPSVSKLNDKNIKADITKKVNCQSFTEANYYVHKH